MKQYPYLSFAGFLWLAGLALVIWRVDVLEGLGIVLLFWGNNIIEGKK